MNNKLIIIFLVLIVILGGLFFAYNSVSEVPDKNYVGNSSDECSLIQVTCVEGFRRFDNENGCGCEKVTLPTTEEVVATLFTTDIDTTDWKKFTNTKYNYSFQYPPELFGPISQCGGIGIPPGPVETCRQVIIDARTMDRPAKDALHDEQVEFLIKSYSGTKFSDEPSLKSYVEKVLSEARIFDGINMQKVNRAETYTAVFNGSLKSNTIPLIGGVYGGVYYENKHKVIFIPMGENKFLRILYPVEFCAKTKEMDAMDGSRRWLQYKVDCYSDKNNDLYENIAQTLIIEN